MLLSAEDTLSRIDGLSHVTDVSADYHVILCLKLYVKSTNNKLVGVRRENNGCLKGFLEKEVLCVDPFLGVRPTGRGCGGGSCVHSAPASLASGIIKCQLAPRRLGLSAPSCREARAEQLWPKGEGDGGKHARIGRTVTWHIRSTLIKILSVLLLTVSENND